MIVLYRLLAALALISGLSKIFLRGAPIPKVGVLAYYFANFLPKTAWKWKNLDPKGIAYPWRPLESANANGSAFYRATRVDLSRIPSKCACDSKRGGASSMGISVPCNHSACFPESYIPEKRLIFISLFPRSRRTTQILTLQDQKNMPQSVFLINESLW